MTLAVTQQMRNDVSSEVSYRAITMGISKAKEYHFSDEITLLIYREMMSDALKISRNHLVELLVEATDEKVVHEYVELHQHFPNDYSLHTRIMLIHGLHRPERNRSWMDPSDPDSVQRTTALLKSIIKLRKESKSERLLTEVLAYVDYNVERYYDQSFKDVECTDLIIDHPDRCEELIALILERGYQDGMYVFRERVANNAPSLSNGVL